MILEAVILEAQNEANRREPGIGARHSTITTGHPDAVVQAIRDLLEEVRRGPAGGLMPAALQVDSRSG